ncbi:MAG: hypothetical protein Q4E12_01240 [Coriobacteriia bacterium]|nr:hypothetical protein [Coriobacteriia bacterium]
MTEVPHQPAEYALNLCEVGHQAFFSTTPPTEASFTQAMTSICTTWQNRLGIECFPRIYLGSYFCDRLFASMSESFMDVFSTYVSNAGTACTLVVPLFSQNMLQAGKKRLAALLERTREDGTFLFDEVVANDPATAQFAQQYAQASGNPVRLAYGRMMAKTTRDPRHSVLEETAQPYAVDAEQAAYLREQGYTLLECDPFAPVVDTSALENALPLALHLPHCLMTTGHVCEAAGTNLDPTQKFRPCGPCQQECLRNIQVYESFNLQTEAPVYFTRLGRTIFFENPGCALQGQQPQRIIWTPADYLFPAAQPAQPVGQAALLGGQSWE